MSGPLSKPPPDAAAIASTAITNTICNTDAVTRSQRPGNTSSRRASPNRRRTKRPIAANTVANEDEHAEPENDPVELRRLAERDALHRHHRRRTEEPAHDAPAAVRLKRNQPVAELLAIEKRANRQEPGSRRAANASPGGRCRR